MTDGAKRWILQVVLSADDSLRAIRMVDKEHAVKGVDGLFAVVRKAHVLFLVHSLKLRVEAAEHAVHEAVGLDARPVLHLVGRDFLHIACHVVGSEGV